MPAELDLSAAENAAATGGQGQTQETQAAQSGADQVAQAVQQAPDVSGATGTQNQEAQSPWTLRSELQSLGVQGEYQDDKAAWGALTERLRAREQEYARAQQIAQYYLANQQSIQAALLAQQQAQQPAAKPADDGNPWKVPEWNPQWRNFLQQDANGNIVAVMGADPSLPLKYQAYREWQQQTMERMLTNPLDTLKSAGIEKLIEEKAQALINQHLGSYDDRQFANSYVQRNDWMFAKGQNGQTAYDSFGSPILSEAGQRFSGYVRQAEQMGITNVRQQQAFAESMTQRDALAAYYSRSGQGNPAAASGGQAGGFETPEQTNARVKQQAVRGGSRRLPSSGAQGNVAVAAPPGQQNNSDIRLSLADRLSKRLRESGVSEIN